MFASVLSGMNTICATMFSSIVHINSRDLWLPDWSSMSTACWARVSIDGIVTLGMAYLSLGRF